jgi:hypothetical protein
MQKNLRSGFFFFAASAIPKEKRPREFFNFRGRRITLFLFLRSFHAAQVTH